ncbi:MAG: helix-turn-helix transcriptional regulator [Bacteroidia bacterium]|jgi:HTH-type transcriptional regulator/antitoxin HigA
METIKKTTETQKYKQAEARMNELLAIATQKGGFDKLSKKESAELDKYTEIVKEHEDRMYHIPLPQTIQGLIELKMYENKIKQKELAKMLRTTETKLSEILNSKRKPNVSFLKALHEILGIDGNLLLEIA